MLHALSLSCVQFPHGLLSTLGNRFRSSALSRILLMIVLRVCISVAASSPAIATNCPADKASAARRRAVMAAEGSGGGGVAGIMLTHQQRSGSEREREVERESRRV